MVPFLGHLAVYKSCVLTEKVFLLMLCIDEELCQYSERDAKGLSYDSNTRLLLDIYIIKDVLLVLRITLQR